MELIINIDVDDIDKAIAFYSGAPGLRLKRRLFDGAVAELEGASSLIQLLRKPAGSPIDPAGTHMRDYARHWTPVHIDFCVDDIAVAVERARHAGARLERGIDTYAWGRIASMSDPFGHGLCLMQLSDAGYNAAA